MTIWFCWLFNTTANWIYLFVLDHQTTKTFNLGTRTFFPLPSWSQSPKIAEAALILFVVSAWTDGALSFALRQDKESDSEVDQRHLKLHFLSLLSFWSHDCSSWNRTSAPPSSSEQTNKTPETLRQHVPHSLNQSSQSGHKTNRERSRQSNRQSQDATVHTDPTTVLMPSLAFSTKERSVFLSTACQTGNGFSLTFWAATSRSDKNIQLILKQSLNCEGQTVHDNTLFHVKSV